MLGAISAVGASPLGPTIVHLGATNEITGRSTSSEYVRVDAPAIMQTFPYNGIHGNGRLVGFLLTNATFTLFAHSDANCYSPGCQPADQVPFDEVDATGQPVELGSGRGGITIPAGDYQLILLADAAEVRVTLPLGGLRGSTITSPMVPVVEDLRSIAPTLAAPPPAQAVYTGGGVGGFQSPQEVLFTSLTVSYTGAAVGTLGTCVYLGGGPPGGVYVPGCPGSPDGGLSTTEAIGGHGFIGSTTTAFVDTRRSGSVYGLGGYYEGAFPGPGSGQLAMWLALPPIPAASGGATPGIPATAGSRPRGQAALPLTRPNPPPAVTGVWFAVLVLFVLAARRARHA